MAFDYTNLYPDTSANGGYTKSWNYTTVTDSIATCSASGYFNKVATRLGIGDNIVVARVDAFESRTRTTLVEYADLFVAGIAGGVVTTLLSTTGYATIAYVDAASATAAAATALKANIASPTFTGVPAAPTAAPATNTTQLATTAYADAIAALKSNIASPTFTGTPAAPTAAVDTNTAQLATTAMVLAQAASATPLIDGAAAVGTSTRFARGDHVHPTDTTRAPVASPTFTGQATVSSASGGIGYSTGAGGTVTQATSKATGVTLSKASGAITMNAAALAAGTIVSFVLTNTSIAATDVLVLNHISGGTVGSYLLNAQCAAGSATINVRNETAGSLSEAIVIQFALIKAVNA